MSTLTKEQINVLQEMERRGLTDRLKPEERDALKNKLAPMVDQSFKKVEKSFDQVEQEQQSLFSAVKGHVKGVVEGVDTEQAKKNPISAAANAIMGVADSFNIAPLFDDSGIVTTESLLALPAFPFVRGAEIVQNMFLSDEEKVPLTPLIGVIDEAERLGGKLSEQAPGVREAAELGAAALGVAQLAKTGTVVLAKNAPKLLKRAKGFRSISKAAKVEAKLASDLQELSPVFKRNGDLVNTVINEPEEVLKFVQSDKAPSALDLGKQLTSELSAAQSKLGSKIGKFRDAAFADDATRVKAPKELKEGIDFITDRTTFQGDSLLPPKVTKVIEKVGKAVDMGVVTPKDLIQLDGIILDVVKFGDEAKGIGVAAVKDINPKLLEMRSIVKDTLRGSSKEGAQWAELDGMYTEYLGLSGSIGGRIKDAKRAGNLVPQLLNPSKEGIVEELVKLKDLSKQIDPSVTGGAEFLSKVAQMKSGSALKDIDITFNRGQQDLVQRFVNKYADKAQAIGTTVATVLGGAAGGAAGGGVGLGGGALAANKIAGRASRYIGQQMGLKKVKPEALLRRALKAKNLNKQGKVLAQDLLEVHNKLGVEGLISALDFVGATPASIGLMEAIKSDDVQPVSQKIDPKIAIDLETMIRRSRGR